MNMKKLLLLLFVALSSSLPLDAWNGIDFTVETRVSYFHPFSKRVRDIYGDGWANFEVEASQTMCNEWTIWERASGWPVTGRSTALHNRTKMRLWSLQLGVIRQFFISPYWRYYFGLGASYNFFNIHDSSHYVRKHFSKNEFGGVARTGVHYFFRDYCFIDINLEYQYQKFDFSRHRHSRVSIRNVNLSGIQIGGGLGILF
jgi:hypothetical protein